MPALMPRVKSFKYRFQNDVCLDIFLHKVELLRKHYSFLRFMWLYIHVLFINDPGLCMSVTLEYTSGFVVCQEFPQYD